MTHRARFGDWICTRCDWAGQYAATMGVTYRSIDWQHCPSCNCVAIPTSGSTETHSEQDAIESAEADIPPQYICITCKSNMLEEI